MKLKEIRYGPAASRDAEQGYKSLKYEIYEWLSAIFVKLLLYTPVTPNQVTIVGTLLPFLAAFFFGFGSFGFALAGISCLYLGELMDAIDGTLARCKKKCSRLQSNFLGNLYHSSSYPILFLGIGFGVFMNTGNPLYVLLGALSSLFQEGTATLRFLKNTVMYKNHDIFKKNKDILNKTDESELFNAKGKKSLIMSLFGAPMKHLRLAILFIFVLEHFYPLGWVQVFVIFYGIFIPIKALGFSYTIYRSFQRIESKNK